MKNIDKHIFKKYWASKKVEEVVEPVEDDVVNNESTESNEDKQEEVTEDGE